MDRKPIVEKLEKGDKVFFTISWSRLRKSDKYDIIRAVPSEAGIYELYTRTTRASSTSFTSASHGTGGFATRSASAPTPILEEDPARKQMLEEADCWYRWSLISNSDDMADILWFFARTYFPRKTDLQPSGRYANVFVKEVDADKIVTI